MAISSIMGQYSIKQLESISGVKAHTIRIWEQRYNLLEPLRTDSNIRYYNDDHLKRLLNVALLINKGYKVSKLAKLDDGEIKQIISDDMLGAGELPSGAFESRINAMLIAMIDYDEHYFEKIFSDATFQFGFKETILKLIYPFLHKVGIMWGVNDINPAQEHFISNLIRQKIIVAINGLTFTEKSDRVFVMFLPEGELHELGLLVAYYLAKQKGHKVIYLGQNVPLKDVLETMNYCKPTDLFTLITNPGFEKVDAQEYLNELAKKCKKENLYVSLAPFSMDKINVPKNGTLLKGIADFTDSI